MKANWRAPADAAFVSASILFSVTPNERMPVTISSNTGRVNANSTSACPSSHGTNLRSRRIAATCRTDSSLNTFLSCCKTLDPVRPLLRRLELYPCNPSDQIDRSREPAGFLQDEAFMSFNGSCALNFRVNDGATRKPYPKSKARIASHNHGAATRQAGRPGRACSARRRNRAHPAGIPAEWRCEKIESAPNN